MYLDSIYTLSNAKLDIKDFITPQTSLMQKLLGNDYVFNDHGNEIATNKNGIQMS
jgi:hypothetical protein